MWFGPEDIDMKEFDAWYDSSPLKVYVTRHHAWAIWTAAIASRNNEIINGSIFIKD
jgi:hypothetical protein